VPTAEDDPLPAHLFRRYDESDDALFYSEPRFVLHIDDAAVAAIRDYYRDLLPEGARILDLMSSWVSHLPGDRAYATVTGLGLNGAELAANPRLTERTVHDLNRDPQLPFEDAAFAGAGVSGWVQYQVHPVEVFAEVGRVLVEGAPFAVTFSNRCFPTKAVAAWQMLDDRGHMRLVADYFRRSGAFEPATALDLSPNRGRSDPVYAVVARRQSGP
jgi:hypothetical protein